jgi:hypothetical protein
MGRGLLQRNTENLSAAAPWRRRGIGSLGRKRKGLGYPQDVVLLPLLEG